MHWSMKSKDAIKITQGINDTLKTLYDVANINMNEAIPFSKIDQALDDTFTLAEISRKSPILELQEDDDSSFESLKKALLDAKVAQDRLNHTNNLYLKGSKNVIRMNMLKTSLMQMMSGFLS